VAVAISKGIQAVKLLQHNPPIVNWVCLLTHVVMYDGRKMVVCCVCMKQELGGGQCVC